MKTIKFVNKNTELTFDTEDTWTLDSVKMSHRENSYSTENFNFRLGKVDKFQNDGSFFTGDKRLSARGFSISFDWTVSTNSDSDFLEWEKNLFAFFLNDNGPLYFQDLQDDEDTPIPRMALVTLMSFSNSHNNDCFRRAGVLTLAFSLNNSFFEDLNFTTETGTTLTTVECGSIPVYPEIELEFTAPTVGFVLKNGEQYIAISSAFETNQVLKINIGQSGEFVLDDEQLAANSFEPGSAIFLLDPGENEIEFSSESGNTNANVTVRFRNLWPS